MEVSTLPRRPVENWEAVRDEWVAAVERIADDAEAWAPSSNGSSIAVGSRSPRIGSGLTRSRC